MIRNRVRWGYGLLALLLTLSTVACGGDEPAPVVQPPAPPPAPPPFQPQAVEVALGESGNVTLMTTEDGGFTLNGEAFESGGTVAAENGNMYLLTLADGKWSAAYQASEAMVTLGITEETVTLTKGEDGSYMIGEMAVTSGETMVTATNGNMYTLSMDEDGMWMATYVEPVQTVMLGTHGGSAMVKKSEDGSYWLGDMTVMDGTVVSGEGGREYTLMKGDDGMWMATFVEHVQTVTLGTHGGSTMVKKSEDGSYWVGDMTVMNGSTVTGTGGREYTLMMGDDGMWMATFVEHVDTVTLGMSGSSVMIKKSEDGSYWIGDQTVMSGVSTATAMYMGNTNTYTLTQDADGHWSASYVPEAGTVAIGAISIPAMRAEGGAWSAVHPQTGETVMLTEGGMVTATNLAGYTNTYTLSSDGGGMWTAAYQSVTVPVTLGTSGDTAMLTRAEDGSYWHDGDAFESGDEAMAENGNDYVLTYADGAWTAMFRPDSMEIKGTGLTAMTLEDQSGYSVAGTSTTVMGTAAGQLLTIMEAGDDRPMYYRVWKADGELMGARTDRAGVDGDTDFITYSLAAMPRYNINDRGTPQNEANTKLIVAGEEIGLGSLFGSGSASKVGKEADGAAGDFVKDAVKKLTDLRTEAELYARYQAENADARGSFDENLTRIANDAQTVVDTIFDRDPGMVDTTLTDADTDNPRHSSNAVSAGLPTEDPDATTAGDTYIRATDTIRGLTTLLDALSSADAFVEATAAGKNGIFEGAFGETAARNAFSANKSEYEAWFGSTKSTRFGAIMKNLRVGADPDTAAETDADTDATPAARYDLRYAFDGAATGGDEDDEDVGAYGAFAYATSAETARARLLQQAGGARYEGETVAVTPGKTSLRPNRLYRGEMRIDVNFRRSTVFGRISELQDKDSNLWQYLDRDVAEIYLPEETYNSNGIFGTADGDPKNATIVYAETHGFPLPTVQNESARFSGRFIGGDGAEITGVWSLGEARQGVVGTPDIDGDTTVNVDGTPDAEDVNDPRDILYGAYGVTRTDARGITGAVPTEDASSGAKAETLVVPDGTTIADGYLRLGMYNQGGDAQNEVMLTEIFSTPGTDAAIDRIDRWTDKKPTFVSLLRTEVEKQRQIYEIFISFGTDSADRTEASNAGRQRAWAAINDAVRKYLFFAADGTGDASATLYDSGTDATMFTGRTDVIDSEAALGSLVYPMTRTNKPDDDAALERIDALLDAIKNAANLHDAQVDDSGGVFDSKPATNAGRPDPFPIDIDDNPNLDGDLDDVTDMFNERVSKTLVRSLSTDYTRFGVWWREQNTRANQDHLRHVLRGDATQPANAAASPNGFAYSWLEQSSYRLDRVEQTYPSEGVATYTGHSLAILDNLEFIADAEIKVTWAPVVTARTAPTSTVLPKFSNFRDIDNGDPLLYRVGDPVVTSIVDEIAFLTADAGSLPVSHAADGKLGVMASGAGDAATGVSSVEARLTLSTRTGAETFLTLDTDVVFMAKFVGESLDGPLAITGYWSIPTFNTNGIAAQPTRDDLMGAFGADLTDFETVFIP